MSPLSKYYSWAPGPVGDMRTGARGWILWTSLAIMSSDSLVALIPTARKYVSKLVAHASHELEHDAEVETDDRLVPTQWVLWGIVCSTTAGVLLVWLVFGNEGIKPWATLLSFVLGALLSILGYVMSFFLRVGFHFHKGSCTWRNGYQSCQRAGENESTTICCHSTRKRRRQYHCWWCN